MGWSRSFPLNIALAAIALRQGKLFRPCDKAGVEHAMDGPLAQVVVTSIGHWRGEVSRSSKRFEGAQRGTG